MPDKKSTNILDKQYQIDIQKLMQNSDSYKSLIYGIVTVVVLFVVIALGIRSLSQNKAQIDNEAASTQSMAKPQVDNRYTVAEGETLWSIAEKSYNNGFLWNEIAKANNITDPTTLSTGTKLVIPNVTPQPEVMAENTAAQAPPTTMSNQTAMPSTMAPASQIAGSSYTVVHGDNLWDIAVRAYGDGYRWTDIANASHLENPGLIFSGNVLTLPRP